VEHSDESLQVDLQHLDWHSESKVQERLTSSAQDFDRLHIIPRLGGGTQQPGKQIDGEQAM
jgi:hypothetical protein